MNPGVYLQDFRLGFKNQVTAGWPGRQVTYTHKHSLLGIISKDGRRRHDARCFLLGALFAHSQSHSLLIASLV